MIREYVNEYFKFRGLHQPTTTQAFLFLVSEVGELGDKIVQKQSDKWVRNHPENKDDDIEGEIGDVLMMLTKVADTLGLDPFECMQKKFARKGFISQKKGGEKNGD